MPFNPVKHGLVAGTSEGWRWIMSHTQIWIGLADVTQRIGTGILCDAKGAWVNVLIPAANPAECRSLLHSALELYGLELQELQELEPLDTRLETATVERELLRLAEEARASGYLRFGEFHSYPDETPVA